MEVGPRDTQSHDIGPIGRHRTFSSKHWKGIQRGEARDELDGKADRGYIEIEGLSGRTTCSTQKTHTNQEPERATATVHFSAL
jgi:hypothetical protein